jgi:hypothetical protein
MQVYQHFNLFPNGNQGHCVDQHTIMIHNAGLLAFQPLPKWESGHCVDQHTIMIRIRIIIPISVFRDVSEFGYPNVSEFQYLHAASVPGCYKYN